MPSKKKSEEQGQVTGGKWMGRVVAAAQQLAYNVGFGTSSALSSGQAALDGLMNAIHHLAEGKVSVAQKIGAAIAKSAGAQVEKLKGLDQKPFADADTPSLAGLLKSAFADGAKDGEKHARKLKRTKGKARGTFAEA